MRIYWAFGQDVYRLVYGVHRYRKASGIKTLSYIDGQLAAHLFGFRFFSHWRYIGRK